MTDNRILLARGAAAVVLAGVIGLTAAPLGAAAPVAPVVPVVGVAPVADGELAAARDAAGAPGVLEQLGRFFARKGVPPAGASSAAEAEAAVAAAPRLTGETAAVYTLDPGFVAGTTGSPVARPEFVASKAVAADGSTASVWTVKQGGGWRVVNIATGGDETDYPARAATGGGGVAFREPQIGAWYVQRGERVLPLNAEAKGAVGAGGVTLAEYRRQVRQRYGDKLPGSAYDLAGRGGGYEAEAPGGAADTPEYVPPLTAGAALTVTVLATAAVVAARRRRS
ncbi:hypothetical protein [Kitasatospora camelliae]|uniref:LPXTG-motif cell wall-anchored protein n=1 Tax=Kitasatospora camelliae TaxID=3156397 RepID=A0AAU8JZ92_9ACTN